MPLINTVTPEKATGEILNAYKMFEKVVGIVPKPFELLSASPGLFALQLQRNKYYGKHPKLSFALLAHIRYLASRSVDNPYCIDFNRQLLAKLGMEDTDIDALEADPANSMLEDNENAMLSFVIRAIKEPGSTTQEEVDNLVAMGWEEGDLIDALAQGAGMIDVAILMKTFKMDEHCLRQQ